MKLNKRQLIIKLQLGKNTALELCDKQENGEYSSVNIYEDIEQITAEYIAACSNIGNRSDVFALKDWFNWEYIEEYELRNNWDLFLFGEREEHEYIQITQEAYNELLEDLKIRLKEQKQNIGDRLRHLREWFSALKSLEQDECITDLLQSIEKEIKDIEAYYRVKLGKIKSE